MFRNKTSNKLGWVGGTGVVLPQGTINSVNCSLTVSNNCDTCVWRIEGSCDFCEAKYKYRATLEQGHELHEVLTNTVDIDPPSASTSNAASNTETRTSNVASNT